MHILRANLRHLYQRRGLWLAYLLLGFIGFGSIVYFLEEPAAGQGTSIGPVLMMFLVGVLAAVLQREILAKPFAFCLPGHRQMVRQFIFLIGVIANAAGAMIFLLYPGLFPAWRVLVLCSAFFAGLVFYLAGVWVSFYAKQPGFMGLVVFAGLLLKLHIVLERVIVFYPVQVITVGLLCASLVWVRLNVGELARRNCLRPRIGFVQLFNREQLRRFQQARGDDFWRRLKDHPRPWVSDFFLGRMNRQAPLGLARLLWGSLYASFAVFVSQWKNVPIAVLLMAILLGYAGTRMWWVIPAFAPLVVIQAIASRPTLHSTMLTAGGRAERFVSTLAIAIVSAGLLALLITAIIGASILLTTVMPEITFRGLTLTYHPLGLGAFYAPLVVLPLVCTIQLLFHRRPILMIVVLVLLMYLVVFIGMLFGNELTRMASPGIAALLAVASWLLFTSGVYRAAMHRDLAIG